MTQEHWENFLASQKLLQMKRRSLHPAVTLASRPSSTAGIQWHWPQPKCLCQAPGTPVEQIPFAQPSANVSPVAGDTPGLLRSCGPRSSHLSAHHGAGMSQPGREDCHPEMHGVIHLPGVVGRAQGAWSCIGFGQH